MAQLQSRLSALEQENTRLRTELQDCHQRSLAFQARVAELERANALLQAELAAEAKLAASAKEQKKAVQERGAQLAQVNDALKKTLDKLATEPKLEQYLGHVLVTLNEQLGTPASTLWFWDADGVASLEMTCFEGQVLTGEEQWRGFDSDKSYRADENPVMREVLHTRRSIVVNDLANPQIIHPEHRGWIESLNVESLLVIPLMQSEQILGTLNIHNSERTFSDQQIELGYALAQQVTQILTQLHSSPCLVEKL